MHCSFSKACAQHLLCSMQEKNRAGKAQLSSRYACLSNITSHELRSILLEGRSVYGRGCLNEPFRMLSGLQDEVDLALLSTAPLDGPHVTAALALTLRHLASCVPLVLEMPESLQLARHMFPQVSDAFRSMQHLNKGTTAPAVSGCCGGSGRAVCSRAARV